MRSLDQVLRWVAFGLGAHRLQGQLPADVDTEALQIPRGLGIGVEPLRAVNDTTLTIEAHGLTHDELGTKLIGCLERSAGRNPGTGGGRSYS